jgi:uncharacterized protein (TIGR00299 family) protein
MSTDILYLDCFAGISGDMAVGALLDCGVPTGLLTEQLTLLDLGDYDLRISRDGGGSISATSFRVEVTGSPPGRKWSDIRQLLTDSRLGKKVKELAIAIFTTLADAEATVHGCKSEDVHFHEVGAVDSIIDIVSFAICFDHLRIARVSCSPLPMPGGMVSCEHGLLPLPAPAVCEILKGVPVRGVDLDQELVTPTGAAIVKTISDSFGQFPTMTISKTGYGRGSHKLADNRPNLLRAVIGTTHLVGEAQEIEVVECNLDDWSPEGFPHLTEKLFELGVLDVVLVPIQMKKGRPGFQIQILCPAGLGWEAQRCLLRETSAIGLRYRTEKRWTLPRRTGTIETPLGPVEVKLVETPDGPVLYPEYESCRQLALEKDLPLKEVYSAVNRCQAKDFKEEEK